MQQHAACSKATAPAYLVTFAAAGTTFMEVPFKQSAQQASVSALLHAAPCQHAPS